MKTMSRHRRKDFFAGAAAAGAVAVIPSRAQAAEFHYSLGHDLPASHPIGVAANEFAAAVKQQSGGRLIFKVFPENLLGTDASMITQMRTGALQCSIQGTGPISAIAPIANIGYVGFTFPDYRVALAAMDGALGAVIRTGIEQTGLHVFEKSWVNGFRQIANNRRPIRTVDDLVGLKIRVVQTATALDLFKLLGASPVPLDISELYTSLQTHLVDAADGPYYTFSALKLYEVLTYLSVTNHQWSAYWFCVNGDAWKALPPDLQEIFRRNANLAGVHQSRSAILQDNATADFLARSGMRVNTPDTKPIRAMLGPYYQKWKNELGATAWSALEQYSGKLV